MTTATVVLLALATGWAFGWAIYHLLRARWAWWHLPLCALHTIAGGCLFSITLWAERVREMVQP